MENKQFLVLEASAGSGKTYALALRYIYLLLEGAKIGEILTLTFTNKAASEMKQRIGDFLLILGEKPKGEYEKKKQDELLQSLNKEYQLDPKQVLKIAPILLQNFYSQYCKITTIDAFFNLILKKFCWYAGVTHSFKIQELDHQEIEERFLKALKERETLIQTCLAHNLKLQQVLKQIQSAREVFLDHSSQIVDSYDFHSLKTNALQSAMVIKNLVLNHSLSSNNAIKAVDFDSFETLMQKGKTWILKGGDYRDFKKLGLDENLFEELREKILQFLIAKEKNFLYFAYKMCSTYQNARDSYIKQTNAMHFDDVTFKTYKLLNQEEISNDFFYFRLDDKISHILLDEFQDTSVVQYKILKPLIEEILSGEGRIGNRSFFVVGDKKQSIYQFRGGYGKLMKLVSSLSSEIKTQNLTMNYRSCSYIVDFVNQIFSKKLIDYVPQEAKNDGGYVKICDPINLEDEGEERVFETIKEQVEMFLQCGALLEDIAILAFKNDDVFKIGEYLKRYFGSGIITEEKTAISQKKDAQILIYALQCSLELKQGSFTKKSLNYARLLKLLGKKLDEEVVILPLEDEVGLGKVGEFIYLAMKTYALSSKIAQRVLEFACESQDYEDFLLHISSCKDFQEETKGLRILTIHASKGLEFKHLIVLDRLGGENKNSPLFLVQYDDSLKSDIMMWDKQREGLDRYYQEKISNYNQEKEEEKKNLLYVALTRARDSLVILPILKGQKSVFVDLGILEEGKISIPSLYGELKNEEFKEQNFQEKAKEIFVVQNDFGRQEGFIRKEKTEENPNHLLSIKYGEAFHKALELFLGYESEKSEICNFLCNSYGNYLDEKQIHKIIASLDEVKSLIKSNFCLNEVKSEVSFIQDFKLFRIDCLILDSKAKRAIVLDYKSGKEKEHYAKQVRHYVEFVKTQYADIEVVGYLLYLDHMNLVRI